MGSRTSLVEIDLLRAGERMPAYVRDHSNGAPPFYDYRVLVARGDRRPLADLFVFGVRDLIPRVPAPLARGQEGVEVDLRPLIDTIYDALSYDLRIDYTLNPVPPLEGEDAAWADRLLREAGRR